MSEGLCISSRNFRDYYLGGINMAKKCEICGKEKKFGNIITFSHRRLNRSWAPNLRRVRAVVNGTVRRINVCTRCLRSGKVERPQ